MYKDGYEPEFFCRNSELLCEMFSLENLYCVEGFFLIIISCKQKKGKLRNNILPFLVYDSLRR